MISKYEAEAHIVLLVQKIDKLRLREMPDCDRQRAIAQVDEEIKELKQITGPRHIVGRFEG